MKIVEILKIGREMLKMLSENDSNINDWRYIELYEEFTAMRRNGMKVRGIALELSEKYGVGVSTVFKVVRRFGKEC